MTDLTRDLRRTLESTIKSARIAAERGAADALRRLAVFDSRRPAHASFTDARNADRLRLRAHAKSLGDRLDHPDTTPLPRLIEAAAYIQWHRLLFARFLVERDLLRDETGIAISLADCREEAAMAGAGDEWSIAAAHAARLLPGVFPPDDPVEGLTLAPEHAKALRDHLRGLPPAIFAADDSLGWTYQFWRAAEKDAVNKSQVKIGAAELPAVTQLFTEPYMVRFLLHNTLGAWWAGKRLAANPDLARDAADEPALRAACSLPGYDWDFLRFVREDEAWRPAAGTFPGWPARAAAITLLDPCCGSGHFLTEALAALAALRRAEEVLPPAESVVATLRDNISGLEIDGRCVQIAAFALALSAWRIGGAGATLPTPHVAWVGAPPPLAKAEFLALANGDTEMREGLAALHDLFAQAPLLGSLIEVTGGDLLNPGRMGLIEERIGALVTTMRGAEPERAEGALAARGMADAAAILTRRFVLQTTNVPFLGRGKQNPPMATYLAARYPTAKADLATAMLTRMRALAAKGGTVAAVTPQNWLFLGSYKKMREALLTQSSFVIVGALGSRCFETISGAVVNAVLVALTEAQPDSQTIFAGLDANDAPDPAGKASVLLTQQIKPLFQRGQSLNPNSTISTTPQNHLPLLQNHADAIAGVNCGDEPHFGRMFWEIDCSDSRWALQVSAPDRTILYSGYSYALLWEKNAGCLRAEVEEKLGASGANAWLRGAAGWGKLGVTASLMQDLPLTLFGGALWDGNTGVILPKDPDLLPAIWTFCESGALVESVRQLNKKISVTLKSLVEVPFDVDRWKKLAAERYPDGLPEPYSDDPTQWLFHGHPRYAHHGTELHIGLSRLAGYRWPAEIDQSMRLSDQARTLISSSSLLPESDEDGLLALVPSVGERPLADRLRAYCAVAWDDAWTPEIEATLVAAACERANDKPPKQLTLETWLRTQAARQHTKLFHDRPFLWWITDGRADGFTAVVHYHRLTRANLERLTYTLLGDWITRLGDDPRAEAARVLQTKLALILEGESPYDIFVRWKPLEKQPLGWDPDLDDGVRLNIRPFIEAGVLAYAPNVKYGVDRGKDVASAPWVAQFNGERRNDHHTTLAEKHAARDAAGR